MAAFSFFQPGQGMTSEVRLTDNLRGFQWVQNSGNHIRIERGDPNAAFASQRIDYAKVFDGGKFLDRFGNPITGVAKPGDTEAAHIPLYIWKQCRAWYRR